MRPLLLALVLLAGCAAPPKGPDLINASIAVTAGHADDPGTILSPLQRKARTADSDAWQKVRCRLRC